MIRLLTIVTVILISTMSVGGRDEHGLPQGGADNDTLIRLAKKSFELSEAGWNLDTLFLVSGSRFFYYPFGGFKSISSFQRATRSVFAIRMEILNSNDSGSPIDTLFRFECDHSYVKCFLAKGPEETNRLEIVSARVVDSKVRFGNGIHIGISKSEFMREFFSPLPENILGRIRVVQIASVRTGIWHYYTFNREHLTPIVLDTDFQFPKD
jgi:hypothetical protein